MSLRITIHGILYHEGSGDLPVPGPVDPVRNFFDRLRGCLVSSTVDDLSDVVYGERGVGTPCGPLTVGRNSVFVRRSHKDAQALIERGEGPEGASSLRDGGSQGKSRPLVDVPDQQGQSSKAPSLVGWRGHKIVRVTVLAEGVVCVCVCTLWTEGIYRGGIYRTW